MRQLLILSILASLVFSCNPSEILEPTSFESSVVSYVYGDTVNFKRSENTKQIQRFLDLRMGNSIVLHDTISKFTGVKLHGQPTKVIDLSRLKNTKDLTLAGKQLEYIAIGSSLTAGMRDGGYFNEGILTAYPELIARQMKLVNFKSPVFESTDYNGIGRKIKTKYNPTQGPVQKFAVVTNNTAILGYDENLKTPKLKRQNLKFETYNNLAIPGTYFNNSYSLSNDKTELYKSRFAENPDGYSYVGIRKAIDQKKSFDFFTFESGSADFLSTNQVELSGLDLRPVQPGEITRQENFHQYFLRNASEKGIKGVVIGTPDYLLFPAYMHVPCGLIEKNSNNILKNDDCYNGFLFGNTSYLDTLASPVVNINLKTAKMFDWMFTNGKVNRNVGTASLGDGSGVENYNALRKKHAEGLGFPFVDIKKVYDTILAGKYVTNDGVLVNPDWKTGNFFSEDGIFPTAFGHAIIANEIIKVINTHYKTDIPLIPTREYLK